tara:strand:- start:1325 stop:1522 length:198 start_codon:yes stop_codon:yes gene_type:complete
VDEKKKLQQRLFCRETRAPRWRVMKVRDNLFRIRQTFSMTQKTLPGDVMMEKELLYPWTIQVLEK